MRDLLARAGAVRGLGLRVLVLVDAREREDVVREQQPRVRARGLAQAQQDPGPLGRQPRYSSTAIDVPGNVTVRPVVRDDAHEEHRRHHLLLPPQTQAIVEGCPLPLLPSLHRTVIQFSGEPCRLRSLHHRLRNMQQLIHRQRPVHNDMPRRHHQFIENLSLLKAFTRLRNLCFWRPRFLYLMEMILIWKSIWISTSPSI